MHWCHLKVFSHWYITGVESSIIYSKIWKLMSLLPWIKMSDSQQNLNLYSAFTCHGLPWTKQASKAASLEEHQSVDSLKAVEKLTLRTDFPCTAQQLNGSNIPDRSWKFQFLQLLIPATCNEEPGIKWFKHTISDCICRSNHIASSSVIHSWQNGKLISDFGTRGINIAMTLLTGQSCDWQSNSKPRTPVTYCYFQSVCILKSEIA